MHPRLRPYAVAIAIAAVTLVVRGLLLPLSGESFPLLSAIVATTLAVWLAGVGPAFVTAIVTIAGGVVAFGPERGVAHLDQLPAYAVTLAYGVPLLLILAFGLRLRTLTRALRANVEALAAENEQRRQAESQANRALLELEAIADLLEAGVARCGRDLRYRWANRLYAQWLQRERADVVGQPLRRVMGEPAFEHVFPYVQRVLAGERVEFDVNVDVPGKGTRRMHATYVPAHDARGVPDGWVAVVSDVTERRRIEEARAVSEERLRLATRALRGYIYDWNLLTGEVECSEGFYAMLAFDRDEPISREQWTRRIHPDDLEPALAARRMSEARGEDSLSTEYRVRDGAGEWRWLWDHAVLVRDASGRLVRVVGNVLDITARRRAEEALRAADQRKDEFLAMLAHELRNPLAPIRNAAQILRLSGRSDPQVEATSEIIVRQVSHMTELVDDLLDVSRVTRGLVELDRHPVELRELIAAAAEQVRPAFESRRHRFSIALPDVPLWVQGDRVRLVQVLSNLLDNAAKYTPEGGQIDLRAQADRGEATVVVVDSGVGIAPEFLPYVFDLFSQGTRSLARSQGGLGLGLSLAKSLVAMHGGRIEAASRGPGHGSTFTVRLPLLVAVMPQVSRPAPEAQPSPARPLRLLVVDDNDDAAETLATLLRFDGQDVEIAIDGSSAIERVERGTFDAVLLDIGLPDLNGYEVAKRVRDLPGGREITLIALTGYGQREDRERSRAAGFDHHLVKPVEPQELSSLLRALALDAREARSRA